MNSHNLPFLISVNPEGFQSFPNMHHVQRHLSDLQDYFYDKSAVSSMLMKSDPLIYEYWEMEYAGTGNGLSFGMTCIQPGRIGNEYFLTKGHFHADGMGDEMHMILEGKGLVLLSDREGNSMCMEMLPAKICYYPGHLAHRTINTGIKPLVFVGIWQPNIVHDYETIKRSGFPKVVLASRSGPELINNPRFSLMN